MSLREIKYIGFVRLITHTHTQLYIVLFTHWKMFHIYFAECHTMSLIWKNRCEYQTKITAVGFYPNRINDKDKLSCEELAIFDSDVPETLECSYCIFLGLYSSNLRDNFSLQSSILRLQTCNVNTDKHVELTLCGQKDHT